MPDLSRYMIRSALIYLLLGFTVGGLILTHKGLPFYPLMWRWLPIHIEFLLIGWVVQLVMGVAFWILPRNWTRSQRPRVAFVWIAFTLLNLGIWLIVIATLWNANRGLLFGGRLVEVSAVIFFVFYAWQRVVSREGK